MIGQRRGQWQELKKYLLKVPGCQNAQLECQTNTYLKQKNRTGKRSYDSSTTWNWAILGEIDQPWVKLTTPRWNWPILGEIDQSWVKLTNFRWNWPTLGNWRIWQGGPKKVKGSPYIFIHFLGSACFVRGRHSRVTLLPYPKKVTLNFQNPLNKETYLI